MVNQHPDPDTTRTGVWLLTNTEKMFNTCRLPRAGADILAARNPTSEHTQDITLMLYDFVYTVRVCEDDRTPLSVQIIEDRIRAVVLDVIKRIESGESAVPVGVLTSDDRDRWAEVSMSFDSYFFAHFVTNRHHFCRTINTWSPFHP
jgi:hypothetical protein